MTILLRLVGLALGAGLIWYGFDSLKINTEPRSFTIEEVEQNGVPEDTRFITVIGAQSNGDYFISETQRTKTIMNVITPLFSSGRFQPATQEPKSKTSLVYQTGASMDCKITRDCVSAGPVMVRGIVKGNGLPLEGSNRIAVQRSGYPLADKFIFVEEQEPSPAFVYYLYFLAGGALIIASVLPKSLYQKQF